MVHLERNKATLSSVFQASARLKGSLSWVASVSPGPWEPTRPHRSVLSWRGLFSPNESPTLRTTESFDPHHHVDF
jgi:hypothetical protein